MPAEDLTRRAFLAGSLCACCASVPLTRSFAATSVASTGSLGSVGLPNLLELGSEPMQRIGQTVWVARLAAGLWLHTTTAIITEGGSVYYPANGLILESGHGSVLIDTGYLPEQAETLLNWSRQVLRRPIERAVATHFHRDRTGGIPALQAAGIPTLAHPLTIEFARSHGTAVPTTAAGFVRDTARLSAACELFFPGAGHTRDNIVVWLAQQQVLFGGCFLKSVTSPDLGNLADAVVAEWAGSAQRARARYPTRRVTVPGHGTISGDPIGHTLELLVREPNA